MYNDTVAELNNLAIAGKAQNAAEKVSEAVDATTPKGVIVLSGKIINQSGVPKASRQGLEGLNQALLGVCKRFFDRTQLR